MSKPFGNKGGSGAGNGSGGPTAGSAILGKLIGGQQSAGSKTKVPAYVSEATLERLRNTVVGMQRDHGVEQPPVSLSAFVEDAILAAIKDAEDTYNQGEPYPERPNPRLKTGPPIGQAKAG
ncbi:hypothetical protein QZH56_37165 (plasmid) [Streptomyces olivoreticuli]|uniref:hypothetical protein n=1 Tax=Streptomyces olivoreticuli TaxID=68246 RepID=UPI00265B1B79|nr:hypothetical protein [Streptomyces olivoreticuli]WKK27820.1 hypothetical protein QZH56_37165 [Streptomyces olivoreticuli]